MKQPSLTEPHCFSASRRLLVGLALAGSLLLLSGCGKNDLHIRVEDAGGLRSGSSVIWRGAEVGEVTNVKGEDGKIRVSFEIEESFRSDMHEGISAKIESGLWSGFRPALRLYGGTDRSRQQLKPDAEIPINPAMFPDLDLNSNAQDWLKESARRLLDSAR